ncbi:MAG TPA: TrkA C-terminal domain-containing protein [Actinomycetes bacterium]|nr:TrkA C-terminal domain-containing protein [Actinomycetes bacterium]
MEPDSRLDFIIEDLPGIGRRYEMTGTNGGHIIVIITHSGHRIVHGRNPGVDQASAVELTDQQARKLGAILGGAFFKPAVVEELEAVFGKLLIDWVTLGPASPGAGKTIGELQIRRRTGVTIVAIVRDNQAITVPEPSETLHAGDRLIIIARHQDSGPFHKLVVD